jgi:hypothetical protein
VQRTVDEDLDAFISKRHHQRVAEEGERPAEESYKKTEREIA